MVGCRPCPRVGGELAGHLILSLPTQNLQNNLLLPTLNGCIYRNRLVNSSASQTDIQGLEDTLANTEGATFPAVFDCNETKRGK